MSIMTRVQNWFQLLMNHFILTLVLLLAAAAMLSAPGDRVHAQTNVPDAPTGLTALTVGHDSVTLSWDDPGDSSITGYQVLRRSRDGSEYEDGEGAAEFVAVVEDTGSANTSYIDTTVTPKTRYVYRVKAINPEGTSGQSTFLNVETAETPPVPEAPTGLTASSVSHDAVTLSWSDPDDSSITGYQVLRRSRDGSEYGDSLGATEFAVTAADTGSPATVYTDSSVAAHTRYVYRIAARSSQGLSERSGDAEVETLEAPVAQEAKTCEEGHVPPTPAEIAVTAVPIVVESTTADYFVLYASHSVDGTTVEDPVQVVPGGEGTTTLSENVPALSIDRYRVEKYSIAEPADVDGDCTDDITELKDLGRLNPVNPGVAIESVKGAVAIPDMETFEALAYRNTSAGNLIIKFVISDIDTDRPSVYFQNMSRYARHGDFIDAMGLSLLRSVRAELHYDPEVVSADGRRGRYSYFIVSAWQPFGTSERVHTLLAASLPLVDDYLALWVKGAHLFEIQPELPQYQASRIHLAFDQDILADTDFQALNPGEGYGLLRHLDPGDRPHSRDVVIYEALPNELPRVAGIVSTVPQTSLSHVNLRAIQDNVPNAFIRGALDDFSDLIGSHVHYAVTDAGYAIRAATDEEVDEHYASSRPTETQTPERDLSVTEITPLSDVGFNDWDSFGVKAANVAVLGTLAFPEGTVPDGFAVPFYFYDEFMKHNGLYDDIEEMLEDTDFQSDYDEKVDQLKKLRKKIKKAETPDWIETALTTMHATFPEGTSLRYRSSTNNEDLPGFNGAGLYDSKTQHPEETDEDGISKSLKQVYASLWNFRAFIERDFHRIDHMAAAMGVLVHPNYSDELVNGVAVSTDPAYGTEGTYYVNSQAGEDLVTNPEAHSVPEEALLDSDGTYGVVAFSNQVPPGQLLMTSDQAGQLRRHLAKIYERFADLYAIEEGEQFAIEIEFKITSGNVLAIKQARPWVFTVPPSNVQVDHVIDTYAALTGEFKEAPDKHDGNSFTLRLQFGEDISMGFQAFIDYSLKVTGGRATRASRVNNRNDLWSISITPDSRQAVTVRVPHNLPCTIPGAICTFDGRRLSNRLEHTVVGDRPGVPEQPTGRPVGSDTIHLEWNDTVRADSYEVQLLHDAHWMDLPANGTVIAFDGTSAVIKGLPSSDLHQFRVRALNSRGASDWSDSQAIRIWLDWEAELTAAQSTDLVPAASGYSVLGGSGGALSPDSFVLDGTTYRIVFLMHARESLWLGVHPELPADFSLRVGDLTYLGSESKVPPVTTVAGGYWWPSASPDWSVDDPVQVELISYPKVALGEREKAPVTGEFRQLPAEHDGHQRFSFRIHFSEGVTATAHALRHHVLSVSGGAVSSVRAVGSEGSIWAVSVTPEGHHPVTVGIEADLDCPLSAAVCTEEGRRLYNRMELTVEPREKHPATGAPVITGTVEVGETLTVDTSEIADADGLTAVAYGYQWVSYDGNAHTDIPDATASTHTLVSSDEGKAFMVKVSFTDDAGNQQSLTSQLATMERPYGLSASESDDAVVLTWQLPVGWPYASTYQVLRNRPELGETEPIVHVRFTESGPATYTDTDVEPGVLYVYRVKGVDFVGYAQEASEPVEIRTAAPDSPPVGNSPASGAPAISGTAQVGETLTVDTSGIADADGLTNTTFGYQWLSSEGTGYSEIVGATGETYTVFDSDQGKTVRVKVTFTDDQGNQESLTSQATAAVSATTPGAPRSLAAEPDGTGELSVSWQAPQSDGGASVTGYTVQWKLATGSWDTPADVSQTTVTGASRTITSLELDVEYTVRVIATNSIGDSPASPEVRETPTAQTSQQEQQVENSPAAGLPAITGTPQVGETLAADTTVLTDEDGVDNATFTYQWTANGLETQGATGSTYTLTDDDEGHTIQLQVSFTDDEGNDESLTSAATEPVAPRPNRPATGLPTISGTAKVGQTLTADTSGITDPDGLDNAVFSYQWGASGLGIPGATGPTYTISEEDETYHIQVMVTFTDDAGNKESLKSQPTAPVSTGNSPATGALTITGTAKVGETLTADTTGIADEDGLDNVDYTYQWVRNDGTDDTDIAGATNGTYTLVEGDQGKTVKVRVTFTDDKANEESLTSTATAPISAANSPATGAPTITGTAQVGQTLTAETSAIADEDGLDNVDYAYQWVRNDGTDDTDIAGATNGTYTLVEGDQGKTVKVRVTFTDDSGNSETLTSASTAQVASAHQEEEEEEPETPESPGQPTGLSATLNSDGSITLSWTAPQGDVDGYHILRRRPQQGESELAVYVDNTGTTATTWTDTGTSLDTRYVYRVKARNGDLLSEWSNFARVDK